MACLNYTGLAIASQGEFQDLDKYEEDEEEEADINAAGTTQGEKIDKKASYLYFKPLNERKDLKDWHYKMNFNEQIECMAQGSGWCAVSTSNGYLRIFSHEGIQK